MTEIQMPQYQCHKKVWGLKISKIEQGDETGLRSLPSGSWFLYTDEPGYGPIEVPHSWYQKHQPDVGGYYVVYEDGYESYSPAKPFEDGYSRI